MAYLSSITGIVSTDNSSTTPLSSGTTYTGTGELNGYPEVMVQVATDQNGILYCEFSNDGTNWDTSLSFNYNTSRINPPHVFVKGNRYFRARFENNSGSNQTYLRLYTHYGSFKDLTAPVNGTLAETYDAIVTRPTEFKYEVAMGKRQGSSLTNKFGYNQDVDSASPEVIAAFGGTFNVMTSADTLDVVSSSANDTSAGTGARTVLITGIGADQLAQTETVTLNGVTPVTTSNTWLGVNRVVVLTSGSSTYNEGNITIDDNAGTVGTQAYIPAQQSVTQQCIYHMQTNHSGLADWMYINVNKISGGASPVITIYGYVYSRITSTRYEVLRDTIDTAVENHTELTPSQPFVFSAGDVFYLVAETDTNNTIVNARFSLIEQRIS